MLIIAITIKQQNKKTIVSWVMNETIRNIHAKAMPTRVIPAMK